MKKRILNLIIPSLFLASILHSCSLDNSPRDIDIPRPPDMVEKTTPPKVDTPDSSTTEIKSARLDNSKAKTVTYESCAVYAASNEYRFSEKDGNMILVMVSQLPEEKKKKPVIVPDNMLESTEGLEGPPGANPEMVGKEFILIYDENDEVTEIRLMD